MMKLLSTIFTLLIFTGLSFAQAELSYEENIRVYQNELNQEFADPEESPLTKKDLKKFEQLDFYPINEEYKIVAKFVRTPNEVAFKMITTTARLPVYEKYGEAHFEFRGKKIKLNIYQSHSLRETEEFKNYLFLPFTDLSNGEGSYGGGRYLGLNIPEGNEIIIDFNKAYNPYCAYNAKYSCPIPPKENHLPFSIEAGVMAYH